MVLVCLLVDCNFYIPAEQQDILFVTKINYSSEGHLASSRKKREKTKRDMKYYSNSNILMMHITIFAAFQASSHCLMIYTLITWKPGGNALITSEYVHTNFSKRINIDTLTQRETTKTATTVKTKHIQQLIQFRFDQLYCSITGPFYKVLIRALSRMIPYNRFLRFQSNFMAYVSERVLFYVKHPFSFFPTLCFV